MGPGGKLFGKVRLCIKVHGDERKLPKELSKESENGGNLPKLE